MLAKGSVARTPVAFSPDEVLRIEVEDDDEVFLIALRPGSVPTQPMLDVARSAEFRLSARTRECASIRIPRPGWRDVYVEPSAYEALRLAPFTDQFAEVPPNGLPAWLRDLSIEAPILETCGVNVGPPTAGAFEAPGMLLQKIRYLDRDRILASDLATKLMILRRGEARPIFEMSSEGSLGDVAVAKDPRIGTIVLTSALGVGIKRYRLVNDTLEPLDTVHTEPSIRDLTVSDQGAILASGDLGLVGTATSAASAFRFVQLDGQPQVVRIAFDVDGRHQILGLAGGAVWMGDVFSGSVEVSQPTTRGIRQFIVLRTPSSLSEIWLVDSLGAVRKGLEGRWEAVDAVLPPEAVECAGAGEDRCGQPVFDQITTTMQALPGEWPPQLVFGFGRCTGLVSRRVEPECTGWLGSPRPVDDVETFTDSDQLDDKMAFVTSQGLILELVSNPQ